MGAGGENKRPQFPSIVEGDRVIEIVEGGEEGRGTYGYLRSNSDVKTPGASWVVICGRWYLRRSKVEEQAGEVNAEAVPCILSW